MTIKFQPHDGGGEAALVETTSRANGKWVGPVDATIDGVVLDDIKYPINAPRAIIRSRKNKVATLTFGVHFIAPDAPAAWALFAGYFADLEGSTGTLTLGPRTFVGAMIKRATLTIKGACLRAQLTILF